jgi:hypothetical protein
MFVHSRACGNAFLASLARSDLTYPLFADAQFRRGFAVTIGCIALPLSALFRPLFGGDGVVFHGAICREGKEIDGIRMTSRD